MQSKIELIRHNELQEISVGVCDGFSYKDVELKYPDEFASRARDKLRYRYPQGESYEDVIKRLEPIIFELERTTCPMVVVCHRAVLRCLLAYFLDNTQQEVPYLDVPLHTILKMTPASWSNTLERIPLDVPLDEQTAPSSSSQPAKS
jgi:broad specificity phosphatase PhoE